MKLSRVFPASFLQHLSCVLLVLGGTTSALGAARPALSLHPENPHYFQFRGKPTVIITSAEHYGAVLNLDFDYAKYLRELEKDGMNNTRTFAGAYCEPPKAFNITSNTLAPLPGRFIAPWARSDKPGYASGGNKFDLTRWDPAYFERLRDFVKRAGKHGVIVELNLFCPFYKDEMWHLSPMHAANNVNGLGAIDRTNVYTLDRHEGLLPIQEAMVRKTVTELRDFDNLYYEICNEPYFGGVTLEWQTHVAGVIRATEQQLGVRHLISQNIANHKAKVERPSPEISIFNFHYASPPDTVAMNYGLNKVIGDNETGFKGTNDAPYRMEGWDFIVAGGALFNHLDYSFVAGFEDGTFVYPASQPGGGSPVLRRQLRFLQRTVSRLDFIRMRPQNELIKAKLPEGCSIRILAGNNHEYLGYLRTGLGQKKDGPRLKQTFEPQEVSFELDLPSGQFCLEWLDTKTCRAIECARFQHIGGRRKLAVPAFEEDIALVLRRK